MQTCWSHIRDWWFHDFIDKIENIRKIPQGSFLVTADAVSLYPSIQYNEGMLALKQKQDDLLAVNLCDWIAEQ